MEVSTFREFYRLPNYRRFCRR